MAPDRRLPRIVMATHVSRVASPSQARLIAGKLVKSGGQVATIGRGDSGFARLWDTATRGLVAISRCDTVIVDVFGHRAFVYETISILFGRLLGRRVVVVLRGGWLGDNARKFPRLVRGILSLPHVRIAPHQFLIDEMTGMHIAVDRLIPNFIEIESYPYRERLQPRPRFLFLRGAHAIYNPELCLQAFARVQQRYPDASLTMAGSGPFEDLKRLAERLGVMHVRFPGLVPKESIPALASEHDIYVQTNRVDNMPVTVLEMWALGLPVIATKVGGVPYLVRDGGNGLLVPTEDEAALVAACVRVLEEPGLAGALGRNGRAAVAAHSWDAVAGEWADVLGLPVGSLSAAS